VDSIPGESGETWSYDPNDRIGDPSNMGQVFKGSGRGQPVAVKKVTLRLDSDGERRRREREVEIGKVLAAVPTEHLLPTLDIARVGDDVFIVMPLAKRSLAAALKAADLDDAARLDACRQVAQGLVELAGASVLHRDLKPENVLQHEGRWQLADFGIARSLLGPTPSLVGAPGPTWRPNCGRGSRRPSRPTSTPWG
jgi:serine/threonine-protein kinase